MTFHGINDKLYFDDNKNIGIGITNPSTNFHIGTTDGIVIPVGTTLQRVDVTGAIRYNTDNATFEGFKGTWGSLGGIVDVDQDTYIEAETSAGTDNDELKFFTAGSERMKIDSNGNTTINSDLIVDTNLLFVDASSNLVNINGDLDIWGKARFESAASYIESGVLSLSNTLTGPVIDSTGSDIMIFKTNNTERMRITSDGIAFTSATIKGDMIPDTDNAYDIGSAEFKIRDMYVSDNSLWVGDTHKFSITSGGKMKFRKRRVSSVPDAVSDAGGTEAGALTHSGKSSLINMKLKHWKAYMRSLSGQSGARVQDIFRDNDDDYDEQIGADNWLENGTNTYCNIGNVGIGTDNPTAKLHIEDTDTDNITVLRMENVSANNNWSFLANGSAPTTYTEANDFHICNSNRSIPTITIGDSGQFGIEVAAAPAVGYPVFPYRTTFGGSPATAGVFNCYSSGTSFGVQNGPWGVHWEAEVTSGLASVGMVTNHPVTFKTNNVERMRIDAAGNVGIGTDEPGVTLDVNGDIRTGNRKKLILSRGGTSQDPYIQSLGGKDLSFFTIGSECMRIKEGGNVGIGTNNPLNELVIQKDQNDFTTLEIRNNNTNNDTSGSQILFGGYRDTAQTTHALALIRCLTQAGDINQVKSGALSFHIEDGNNSDGTAYGSLDEMMRLTKIGLGIGVNGASNPQSKLHVEMSLDASGIHEIARFAWADKNPHRDTQSGDGIKLSFHTSSVNNGVGTVEGASIAAVRTSGGEASHNTRLEFWTKQDASTDIAKRMVIGNTGNVGIGTDNPSEKLEVNGNIKSSGYIQGKQHYADIELDGCTNSSAPDVYENKNQSGGTWRTVYLKHTRTDETIPKVGYRYDYNRSFNNNFGFDDSNTNDSSSANSPDDMYKLKCSVKGLYMVSYSIKHYSTSGDTYGHAMFQVNGTGTDYGYSRVWIVSGKTTYLNAHDIVKMDAGDYIKFLTYTTTASSTHDYNGGRVTIALIGTY